ncbi:hypothetical protein OG948_00995 [Embleya sp. NBC_00888]|uniref:hypothetical protein n=1 Tax=Embleya sp. NBC_00888 TaxID=2975960 RepID=UPI0038699B1A|nr:hypothetical protein OG948_00995 [Embleya sp. NBC_00888]
MLTQPPDDYRAMRLGRWADAEVVETRIRRLAALVDHPAPVTDTIRDVIGRPARDFAAWAADHATDFGGQAP